MNEENEKQFDDFLRRHAVQIPDDAPDAATIERLRNIVGIAAEAYGSREIVHPEGHLASRPHGPLNMRIRVLAVAASAAAVLLAAVGLFLWAANQRTARDLDDARWRVGEVMELLRRARDTQVPVPLDAEQVMRAAREDVLVFVCLHQLCPYSRQCEPALLDLERRHSGGQVRFASIDVTGDRRLEAPQQVKDLGIEFALLGPIGAETGVVKVLDTRRHVILTSGAGAAGVQAAERVLAMLAH